MPADIRLTSSIHLREPIRDWGSNGTWLAYDDKHSEHVAVQLGFEHDAENQLTLWQRFRDYARGPAKLTSPRIAAVHDCGVADDGRLYVVGEQLRGESLERRLAQSGPLALPQVGALVQQVAQALSVAHHRGFVHGGLNAHNVVLLASDMLFVKLIELGQSGRRLPHLVSGHAPSCAHGYLAPEQVSRGCVNERTDVWALGVLAYHALTGTLPFNGATLATLMLEISDTPCPPIPNEACHGPLRVVAHRLDAWFRRALHKNPNERFASVESAVAAWREASAADHPDRDFAVAPASFADHLDPDTVTSIAPWLLHNVTEHSWPGEVMFDDPPAMEATVFGAPVLHPRMFQPVEAEEVTTLFLLVEEEEPESYIRAIGVDHRFEDVG
jgi:serine/threonine protein kinase